MSETRVVDPVRAAQAMVGVAARRGRDQAPARRNLTAAKLRRAIQQALADEHPPSPAQCRAMALLLSEGPK